MTNKIADKLREIVGQETEPPLWIYVTKDQVPFLTSAAAQLDAADNAFVAGVLFGAMSMQGRYREAAAILQQHRMASPIA
jgi:hypothetical protein